MTKYLAVLGRYCTLLVLPLLTDVSDLQTGILIYRWETSWVEHTKPPLISQKPGNLFLRLDQLNTHLHPNRERSPVVVNNIPVALSQLTICNFITEIEAQAMIFV